MHSVTNLHNTWIKCFENCVGTSFTAHKLSTQFEKGEHEFK